MDVARSRKTAKVLYLYLTIPLLIIAAVLGMIALMTHTGKARAPKAEAPAKDIHTDAGPSWRPSVELPALDDTNDDSNARDDSTARNAAIMTAIVGGLTGLMGALTQVFVAFMKTRDRRKPESDEDSDDQEQS